MFTTERQQKILEWLSANSRVRVSELSETLGVSEATVRRDLEKLAELGRLQRTHGGAVLAEESPPEPPVVQRSSENVHEKQRIGQAAAALIAEGDTVFIGSGTTALEVARSLVGRHNLTVITNALTVITTLAQESGITLIATGGLFRPSELSFSGYHTEQVLQELRPQKVIMGIRAISPTDGFTNECIPELSTDRVIIRCGQEVIIVADHTKFGKVAAAIVAPLTAAKKIVTDSGVQPHLIDALRQAGVEVIVA